MDSRDPIQSDPDWPRIRRLVAEEMGITEAELEAMLKSPDSLQQVELVMAIEEVMEKMQR